MEELCLVSPYLHLREWVALGATCKILYEMVNGQKGELIAFCKKYAMMESEKSLQGAAKFGNLAVLAELADYWSSRQLGSRVARSAAWKAAAHGHLEALQWLTHHFQLQRSDLIGGDNYAFRSAAENGHLGVLQWLTENFNISRSGAMIHDNQAFRWAAAKGHLEMS